NQRAGYRIRNVIFGTRRMINAVLAATTCATFQPDELANSGGVVQECNKPAVQKRERGLVKLGLGLLGLAIGNLELGELLDRPLSRVFIAGYFVDAVGLENFAEIGNGCLGTKWGLHLAHQVENSSLALAMRDCHRERVRAAARRINETMIAKARVI